MAEFVLVIVFVVQLQQVLGEKEPLAVEPTARVADLNFAEWGD